MKKELLELVREKLLNITNIEKQVDIMEYFVCISEFSQKVGDYKWLSSRVPSCYHNFTIADFVSLDDEELGKIVGKPADVVRDECGIGKCLLSSEYSVKKCRDKMSNQCKIMKDLALPNNDELFADFVLKYMSKDSQFFDTGISLFHGDSAVEAAVKKYASKRS